MFNNTQFAYKFALNLHFRLKIPYYSVVKDRIRGRLLFDEDAESQLNFHGISR
jgi:hypothetical protein